MRRYKDHFLLLVSALCFAAIACSSDDPKPAPELMISTEAISFLQAGETKTMHLKTNTSWSASSSESWCSVTPETGNSSGTIKLTVTVAPNSAANLRSAVLTFTAGTASKQVTVTQGLLLVKQKQYAIAAAGGAVDVDLQAATPYTVILKEEWITRPLAKAIIEKTERFVIAPNTRITSRTGTIILKVQALSDTIFITQAGEGETLPADQTGMPSNGMTLAKKMGIGWNLGNTLESCSATTASETLWGNPKATQALIDAVKAAGFNTVRIPCAWSGYIEDPITYRIKESWLARVKEVVDYCVSNNMYAIINIHTDGGWLENNPTYDKQEQVNIKQRALWKQIALYFRGYDERLLFAGTNEVHVDYGTPTTENLVVQNSFNQTFVEIVRATGGRNSWRNLIIQAYNTKIELGLTSLVIPTDQVPNRQMVEVHCYDPYDFALKEDGDYKTVWGSDFLPLEVTWYGQEAWIKETFEKLKATFVDQGIPVILGEYGALMRSALEIGLADHIKARNAYLHYMTKTALANDIVPVYWDNGWTGNKGFGLFNRNTGAQFYSDAIQAILSGANK